MRNLNHLATLLLLCFSLQASGQNNVNWGPIHSKNEKLNVNTQIIGQWDGHYYVLLSGKEEAFVLKYNTANEVVSEAPLELMYDGKQQSVRQVVETDKGIWGISSHLDKAEKELHLLVSKFEGGTLSPPRHVFGHSFDKRREFMKTVGRELSYTGAHDLGEGGDFGQDLYVSQDGSKVVYANALKARGDRGNETMVFCVMDGDLKPLWSKEIELPFEGEDFHKNQIMVTNDGEVFLTGVHIDKVDGVHYPYMVFYVNKNGNGMYKLDLGDKNNVAWSAGMVYDDKRQRLQLIGLYRDKTANSALLGSFHAEVDLTNGETILPKLYRISKKTLEELSKWVSPFHYHIKQAHVLENGNLQFIAVNSWVHVTNRASSSALNDIDYFAEGFLSACFDPSGKQLNFEVIKRRSDDIGSSQTYHKFFIGKNHSYLLFTSFVTKEDKINYDLDMAKFHRITKLACFDGAGKLKYEKRLFDTKSYEYIIFQHSSFMQNGTITYGGRCIKSKKVEILILPIESEFSYLFGSLKVPE